MIPPGTSRMAGRTSAPASLVASAAARTTFAGAVHQAKRPLRRPVEARCDPDPDRERRPASIASTSSPNCAKRTSSNVTRCRAGGTISEHVDRHAVLRLLLLLLLVPLVDRCADGRWRVAGPARQRLHLLHLEHFDELVDAASLGSAQDRDEVEPTGPRRQPLKERVVEFGRLAGEHRVEDDDWRVTAHDRCGREPAYSCFSRSDAHPPGSTAAIRHASSTICRPIEVGMPRRRSSRMTAARTWRSTTRRARARSTATGRCEVSTVPSWGRTTPASVPARAAVAAPTPVTIDRPPADRTVTSRKIALGSRLRRRRVPDGGTLAAS